MTYRAYFAIAIPFVVSTVTQPFLGAVDTAVLGHLDDAVFMGGVAIGAVIFNTLYWLLGFLRVSTSGFAAQSLGTMKPEDAFYAFLRPALIAILLSLAFVILQVPIELGAQTVFSADMQVWHWAETYYDILIWGAPFVLIGYVNLGWLMGRKLIRETLILQISMNVLNIVLDIVLVVYFGMGVEGVAYATLFSQGFGLLLGLYFMGKHLNFIKDFQKYNHIFERSAFKKIMGANTNLLIRTVCLLLMTNLFVAKGSSMGKEILAANAILFQLQYIIAYLYDGLANASSVFAGKAVGEKSLDNYNQTLKISNVCAWGLNIVCFGIFYFFSSELIAVFTDIQAVVDVALNYSFWLLAFIMVIGHGLVYAGLYNGVVLTSPIRDAMLISFGVFLLVYYLAIPLWQNHGLWLAFVLFSLSRTIMLLFYLKQIEINISKNGACIS